MSRTTHLAKSLFRFGANSIYKPVLASHISTKAKIPTKVAPIISNLRCGAAASSFMKTSHLLTGGRMGGTTLTPYLSIFKRFMSVEPYDGGRSLGDIMKCKRNKCERPMPEPCPKPQKKPGNSFCDIQNYKRGHYDPPIVTRKFKSMWDVYECTREMEDNGECENVVRKKRPKPVFSSLVNNKDCCEDPCKDEFPRFDDLYYKISDKCNRIYQQTWLECCPIEKRKKICWPEEDRCPPIKKRCPKTECPKTACPVCNKHTRCVGKNPQCPRITLPGCCPGRVPPRCHREREPTKCVKLCTPMPAYSECSYRPKLPTPPPSECQCLAQPSMCDVWALVRKRATYIC